MYDLAQASQHDARLYPPFTHVLAYALVQQPETWVYLEPHAHSPRQSQYTYGEPLRVWQQLGNFVYVQSLLDHYCGWVAQSALQFHTQTPHSATHRTISIAPITASASMKSPIVSTLPPASLLSPSQWQDDYAYLPNLGWIHGHHLEACNAYTAIVDSATQQLGRSYVWGGRGMAGLDCSALAQYCYRRAGHNIPRDSDLQALYLHTHHHRVSLSALQAGDLLFTQGHVMIVSAPNEIIHASGHHMHVVREALDHAQARMHAQQGERFYLNAYRWAS